jgi:hypothetical protein
MKILAIGATLLVCCTNLEAHQPGDEFAGWYRSLRVPGLDPAKVFNPADSWCCSPDRDCKTVNYQTDGAGRYWIVANGERVEIPPDKILERTDRSGCRVLDLFGRASTRALLCQTARKLITHSALQ